MIDMDDDALAWINRMTGPFHIIDLMSWAIAWQLGNESKTNPLHAIDWASDFSSRHAAIFTWGPKQ